MDILELVAALTMIVSLMCASTMLWWKCMSENKTSAVSKMRWSINVGNFSNVESENAPKFWAEFWTIIAVVIHTLLILGDSGWFIPGKGWKVLAWMVGAAIITAIPYFFARVMKKKGANPFTHIRTDTIPGGSTP